MKTIEFDLKNAYSDFLKETEGVAWDGWFCPIWATIKDGELKLKLGDPVSRNTTFVDLNGHTHQDWVGNVECWRFTGTKDDYEEYGLSSPDDFDRDTEIENEIDLFLDSFDFSELEEEIKKYCKREGYNIEFI